MGVLAGEHVRIARAIARLNIGGPSIQAITLTARLRSLGYETTLVRGTEEPGEGSMDALADELDVKPVLVASMRRSPGFRDVRALIALIRLLRRLRPHIVHTHAAKAGTLARVGSLLAFPSHQVRPVLVHTFHGHSLSGYFPPRTARVYRTIERMLALRTDRLIAVSEEVRDDLVALRVAPAERFEVIPLGLDLAPFAVDDDARMQMRHGLRRELGIPREVLLVTLVARLVPVKRVDRFLAAATMLLDMENVRFLVVGDGELRDALHGSSEANRLGSRVVWAGFRRDMPRVCMASDVVVLCSDNEGTPVSLIEAAAAAVPTISTRVGGARKVVLDGETGKLVARDDGGSLASAVRELLSDAPLRLRMGSAARRHALEAFSLERLISDVDALYRRLLAVQR